MLEALRINHIGRIIDGIANIGPGPMFERFGAKFLDHHLKVKLVHRGLNKQLNPVGGTIDSYDDEQRVAAEYSAEKGYFESWMQKPSSDIVHVLRKHPSAKEIYLVSSQEASIGKIPEFASRVADWPGMLDRRLHIYDARRIAETIVDELLLNDTAIEDLAEHLPALDSIIDDAAANRTVPALEARHLARPQVQQMVEHALRNNGPVATISGIGGSGKSEAATAFVSAKRSEYHTCMWIDGDKLRRAEDLRAIRISRGGTDRNVAAMLSTRRCLLIIDDATDDISASELAKMCGTGSHVILTRRRPNVGDLVVPMLDEREAREILDRDVTPRCPQSVLEVLLRTVGGHPLSLVLVNKVVAIGTGWDEVAKDCADIPELTIGDERLADRMLGRLEPSLSRELQVFEWAGEPACEQRFLRSVISSIGIAKIRQHGLAAPDRPSTVRLHDIVYASVVAQHWLMKERSDELDLKFVEKITCLAAEEGTELYAISFTMRSKLEAMLVRMPGQPALVLALLEVWNAFDVRPELLPDPVDLAARILSSGAPPERLQVRAALETIEGLYRHWKLVDYDRAKEELRARLPVFEAMKGLTGLDERSRAEIIHHHAKALNILGMHAEARSAFEAVVEGPHPLHAARLQLVRIYSRAPNMIDKAAATADDILSAAATPGQVSNSVLLATVQALPWGAGAWRRKMFDKHADMIAREIIAAADAGSAQAYSALASIGRHWVWHDPDRLKRLLADLQMDRPDILDDSTKTACGELLAQAGKLAGSIDPSLQEKALRYFEAISDPSDFARQKHGQLLVDMGQAADAEVVLRSIKNPKPFAYYWLSKAQLANDKIDEALGSINEALDGLRKQDSRYRSAFLSHRFDVRKRSGDATCEDDLKSAIGHCEDEKYKGELEARLKAIRA